MLLLICVAAKAQDAREGVVRFNKEDRNGVMANYSATTEITEDALEEKLKSLPLGKQHHDSKFWKYEGVSWPEISPNKIDVFFNVDRTKGQSIVYMMVSSGNGNFITSATDGQTIENMKAFLTGFNADVIAWQQKMAIAAQQKEVDEANSDLKRADRATDRANRRQKRADREKTKKGNEAANEQQKLNDLQSGK